MRLRFCQVLRNSQQWYRQTKERENSQVNYYTGSCMCYRLTVFENSRGCRKTSQKTLDKVLASHFNFFSPYISPYVVILSEWWHLLFGKYCSSFLRRNHGYKYKFLWNVGILRPLDVLKQSCHTESQVSAVISALWDFALVHLSSTKEKKGIIMLTCTQWQL